MKIDEKKRDDKYAIYEGMTVMQSFKYDFVRFREKIAKKREARRQKNKSKRKISIADVGDKILEFCLSPFGVIILIILIVIPFSIISNKENSRSEYYNYDLDSYDDDYDDDDEYVTVYVTSTGEKYHRSSCQYLSKSKISISLKKAKRNGYDPCSRCNPPK